MEKNEEKIISKQQVSDIWHHEDAVLKTSMQFFAEKLLPYLNIEGKVVSFAPTELVHLEVQKLFQDFNFVMEDGTWKHFEFQSTNEGIKGLKRFRVYEALTSYQYNVVVETYVLFSGNIKKPMTEFTEGYNTYRVKPIIMQEKNKKDKIEAMLYAMADKFLEAAELEKLKEEIAMTRLGQMIWEDGVAEGELRGKTEILTRQIKIKLEKGKSVEEIAEALEENPETIKELMEKL